MIFDEDLDEAVDTLDVDETEVLIFGRGRDSYRRRSLAQKIRSEYVRKVLGIHFILFRVRAHFVQEADELRKHTIVELGKLDVEQLFCNIDFVDHIKSLKHVHSSKTKSIYFLR